MIRSMFAERWDASLSWVADEQLPMTSVQVWWLLQ